VEKRNLTRDDKLERNKNYDKEKRARKFINSWRTKFPWVRYEEEAGLMFCTITEEFAAAPKAKVGGQSSRENTFVRGNDSHRVESLQIHNESDVHTTAAKAKENASRPTQLEDTPLGVGARMMNVLASKRLSHLFRTAHALAVKSRPFTDFIWQCKLDELKGVDIGKTYRTDKKCKEFIDSIAEVE
jgi:hypothetical protein